MIGTKRQFFVDGYETGESGRHTVIGRNGDEAIRLNDVFTTVVCYRRRKYPDDYNKSPEIEVQKDVKLRVTSIRAYEQELDELGQGMTGTLAVEGEGTDRLGPCWVLEADSHES